MTGEEFSDWATCYTILPSGCATRSSPNWRYGFRDSSLTLWIVSNFWVLPIIQVVHILAIGGLPSPRS